MGNRKVKTEEKRERAKGREKAGEEEEKVEKNRPPNQKPQQGRQEPVVNQINTIMHLGAPRAGKGLADAEELLILYLNHQHLWFIRG